MRTTWESGPATLVLVRHAESEGNLADTHAHESQAEELELDQAMEMYRLDNFTYPSGDGLNALVSPSANAQAGRYRPGGYIKNLPKDPWGRPYQLAVPGKRGPFDIYSLGADGAPGGTDENADIYGSEG